MMWSRDENKAREAGQGLTDLKERRVVLSRCGQVVGSQGPAKRFQGLRVRARDAREKRIQCAGPDALHRVKDAQSN